MPKAIPEGLRTVTPALTVDGCAEAIETWKKAFGAEERFRALDPSGKKIWHADLRIGDSIIFCNDTMPEMPQTPRQARLWIYTEGVDRALQRAKGAGLKVAMPPPNPEAPVVAGPPFPPHGGPQAQAPVRCARTRARGGRHPGERRRDGEVVILLRVHGVFGPETVQRQGAARGARRASPGIGRVAHDGVPDMEGENAVFRKRTARRESEGAGEASQIGVDPALGRARDQVAEPEIGPDESSEVAVAGIGRPHRRRRQRGRLGDGARRHWITIGRRRGIAGGDGRRKCRGYGRRKWRLARGSDGETTHATLLAFTIGVLGAALFAPSRRRGDEEHD